LEEKTDEQARSQSKPGTTLSEPALPKTRCIRSQLTTAESLSRSPFGTRSFVSAGTGYPTVVFEAGLGHGKEAWASAFNAISAQTHAVAYDRAGYGRSERSPHRRDGARVVQELRAMLQHENIPPPYVLVGHSLGGTFAKLFARMYPGEVAGAVLVDARHSEFAIWCRRLGVDRLLYDPPMALFFLARPATRGEFRALSTTMEQANDAGAFPPVPLIVLTQEEASTHWPRQVGQVWTAGQHKMVRMSALGRIKIVQKAGHNVHIERPDEVVRAVMGVVRAARYLQGKRELRRA